MYILYTVGGVKEYDVFTEFYPRLIHSLPTGNILNQLVSKRIITMDDCEQITAITRSQERASLVLRIIANPLKAGITHSFYELLEIMEKYGGDVSLLANEIRAALKEFSGILNVFLIR